MFPGAIYVLGALIVVGFVLASIAIGGLIDLVLFIVCSRSHEFYIEQPSDKNKKIIHIVSAIFTVILFYGLSPIMARCVDWAMGIGG